MTKFHELDKLTQLQIATWSDLHCDVAHGGPTMLAKLIINEVEPRLKAAGIGFDKLEDEHYGFTELLQGCVKGRIAGVLEARHVKKIINDCWSWPFIGYGITQYARETNLFGGEASGSELKSIVKKAMDDNPKAVADLRSGKQKAIGALIGAVIKQTKASHKEVQTIIISLL